MYSLLIQIYGHFSRRRRVHAFLLLILTFIGSIAEVVSLGAVIPFVGIITNPEEMFNYSGLTEVFLYFGMTSATQLVVPLTVVFACAAVVAGCIRLLLIRVSIQLVNAITADLSISAYKRTLYQPLSTHVEQDSSSIISGITQKIGAAGSVLISFVTAATSLILLLSLLLTLLIIDTTVASSAIFVFGLSYGGIALVTHKQLTNNSQCIAREQTSVVKILQEGLGAIRDILLGRSQRIYISLYSRSIRKLVNAQGSNAFINQSPRFIMEMIGMILVALYILILNTQSVELTQKLPIIAALALGAQRMLPLLQQIYGSWATMAGSKAALGDALNLLNQPLPKYYSYTGKTTLKFDNNISLQGVCFKYKSFGDWVIDSASLSIKKGETVGFMGVTGGGKSTLIDLFMGLLTPAEGQIIIDGKYSLGDELTRLEWQRKIAHVPQNIFLSDDSIMANIAFGIPENEIDFARVKLAASQAQLTQFIEGSKEGFNTIVGERGIRLSGGQRQRIGMARALYKKVDVLVLDEATSSLDNATERAVIKSIHNLNKNMTVLMIAHRLSTLKNCDQIVKVAGGKVVWIGSFYEIAKY